MPFKKILLSLNCRADEKSVVDEATRLSSFFEATLSVVHINDPAAGKAHMLMDTLPRIEEEDIVDLFHKFGYGQETEKIKIVLIDGEAYAKEIARATKDFDLLIMGHHPKSRILAALKDSTDERVADRIHCPIMLVPLDKA
ncbi:MAG: universal stress protein [Desulfobacterales bacterium]|jgi:nucleotide-binding universal stress UspA family protein